MPDRRRHRTGRARGPASRALLGTAALGLLAAGCGATNATRGPQLSSVPLLPGARIVSSVRRCDRSADPYCAVQLVITASGYPNSDALLDAEHAYLTHLRWSTSQGDYGAQLAADSPGHALRLTYQTAQSDLEAADFGWIRRAPKIDRALSAMLYARKPALSLMLEAGSG